MSNLEPRAPAPHGYHDCQAEIVALGPWFHNLHLPNGQQTVPDHFLGDFPTYKWREIQAHLPTDLSGWVGT